MKITMYELLGMVKDGKAPKKIKYNTVVWEYSNHERDYISRTNTELFFNDTIDNNWIMTNLNTQIEILEEKKIPEKITMRAGLVGDINNKIENLDINIMTVEDKLNEIIDYLKSKGDE